MCRVRAFLYARVSVVPQAAKPPRAHGHVSHRVANIAMPEPCLNRSQIGATLAKIVAARV